MTGEGGATTTPVAKPSPGTAGGADAPTDGSFAAVARYAGPVKRSITIAGHPTSISLEPVFWNALRAEAEAAGLPISALVARIDAERIEAAAPPNLGSAIRIWLFEKAMEYPGESRGPESFR